MFNKSVFYGLSAFTLLGFSGAGFLIGHLWLDKSISDFFTSDMNVFLQLVLGLIYGAIAGFIATAVINSPVLEPVKEKYGGLMKGLNLNLFDILLISFCAGVGEEILFRGAIQDFIGIVWAALIFVAIHGYLNPRNWRLCMYGIIMTGFIAGMGYMTQEIGLIPAIAAHFAIDVILLVLLTKKTDESIQN